MTKGRAATYRVRPVRPGRRRGWGRAACALVAALAAPIVVAQPAAADNALPDMIRRVKSSIVAVGTYLSTRRPPVLLAGTGFAVGKGRHVVTNYHVIPRKMDTANKEFLCIIVGHGQTPRIVAAKVTAVDVGHDVVVLSFGSIRLPPLKLGNGHDVEEGQEVAFTGYPIGNVLGLYPVTHRGIVSARTPIAIPQLSSRQLDPAMIRRLRDRFEVIQLDATAYPGNSGSPLYDRATGTVYGIVSSVFVKGSKEHALSDPSGITYAIPIDHAQRLLRKLGIAK